MRIAIATLVTATLGLGPSAGAVDCVPAPELTAPVPGGPGLACAWQQSLDAPVGTEADADGKLLFGSAGERSRIGGIQPDGANALRVFVDAAPGLPGERAIAIEVPPSPLPVPTWELRSRHFKGENVSHAGLAVEVFLPAGFRFPDRCAQGKHSPGQGRWPFGLWIGGSGWSMANGVALDRQNGISIRFNRTGGSDLGGAAAGGQAAAMEVYVYNLDRTPARCRAGEADAVCSVNCAQADGRLASSPCPSPDRPCCFGYGDRDGLQPFPRDRWVRVALEVKQNTPGRSDGTVRSWIDGRPAQSREGVFDLGAGGNPANPEQGDAWFVNGFYSYQMWHCQPAADSTPYPRQRYWFRNLRLYRAG